MLCPTCQTEARKFGKDRDGNQRWQCRPCKKTFSERLVHRYSPGEVTGTYKTPCCGSVDPDRICTSHVERKNLTIRMQGRRMTRLTNAFSKKWDNHWAALSLWFAYYNFCRPHQTLSKQSERPTTPAMAAGIEDHPWTLRELVERSTLS